MRELALHLLDILENSLRAGASRLRVTVAWDPTGDTLTLRVEDDGPGLPVAPEHALDPFYTTKQGKRTGLGLPLFQASAEQAGGRLVLGPSDELGGLAVEAMMQASHVDRLPLGDLATTLQVMVCTHPEVELDVVLRRAGSSPTGSPLQREFRTAWIAAALPEEDRSEFLIAARLAGQVRAGLQELELPE